MIVMSKCIFQFFLCTVFLFYRNLTGHWTGGKYTYRYSGANKYLIRCRFFKVSHLQRIERSIIFIVGTPQL